MGRQGSDLSFDEGWRAHTCGQSIAECPWAPADADGIAWRQGWIQAEAHARLDAGTFDHTPDEYAAVVAVMGPDMAPDPVAEILDIPDPRVSDRRPNVWVMSSPAMARISPLMRYIRDAFARVDRQAAAAAFQFRTYHFSAQWKPNRRGAGGFVHFTLVDEPPIAKPPPEPPADDLEADLRKRAAMRTWMSDDDLQATFRAAYERRYGVGAALVREQLLRSGLTTCRHGNERGRCLPCSTTTV